VQSARKGESGIADSLIAIPGNTDDATPVGAGLLAMDCRSRLAGDGLKYAAFIRVTRVIVDSPFK
jgi:hypothetical protein